jgi:hypothetical protein
MHAGVRPKAKPGKKRVKDAPARLLQERSEAAEQMAASPAVTITLRIPAGFNEWLDAYRHLSYPQRIGKQELVIEGLTMAFLRRGRPGQAILTPDRVVRRRHVS